MNKKTIIKTSNIEDIEIGYPPSDIFINPAPPSEVIESDINISEFDQSKEAFLSLSDENLFNKKRLERLRLQFTEKLLAYFVDEDFEYGIEAKADILVKKQLAINVLATKSWLNTIFVNHFSDTNILMGLLRLIARIDYSIISPEGPTIAIAALSHKNIEIKECGVRAFESWGTLSSLGILENLQVSTPWLQSYINDVISDIQKEYKIAVG